MPRCPAGCSLSVILAILIVASGQIRKNCPARCAFAQLTTALPGGDRDLSRCSPLDTDCNLPRLNRYITRHLSFLTTMVRQVPHVNPCAGPHPGLFASAPPASSRTPPAKTPPAPRRRALRTAPQPPPQPPHGSGRALLPVHPAGGCT